MLAFLHAYIKGLLPRLWSKGVEITGGVADVIHASWNRAGGCGEERAVGMRKCFLLVTPDIIRYSSFGYEFCMLESASISSYSNTKENSGSELENACNTIFDMGGPFRIVTMLSMTFSFCLVQFLPLKLTRDVAGGASNIS